MGFNPFLPRDEHGNPNEKAHRKPKHDFVSAEQYLRQMPLKANLIELASYNRIHKMLEPHK